MKSSRVIIIIVLLLLVFGGFSGWQYSHRRIYRELQAVERVMGTHPDSALSLLRKISSPDRLHGRNRAYYALLLTQAYYKNYLPVTDDSLIRIAADYYASGSDSLRKSQSYFIWHKFTVTWVTAAVPSTVFIGPVCLPRDAVTTSISVCFIITGGVCFRRKSLIVRDSVNYIGLIVMKNFLAIPQAGYIL